MTGPMMEMLRAAEGAVRMHMPGHKGHLPQEWLDAALDTTELPTTDDLFAPASGILRAQQAAAQAAGAACTLMLTGGATSGMLAMLLHTLRAGDTVILPRTAHVSAVSGCVLSGAHPVYVWPRYARGMPYLAAEDVLAAVAAHPEARAVLLTRPDYYGQCVELTGIAEACHAAGMRLLVDEAHGAHFNWNPEGPANAGACGADLFVQSAHKTLPVLTGGAWLHGMGGADPDSLRQTLRLVHSSSPSFLILQSLDAARAWMDEHGEAALAELARRIGFFWEALGADGRFANAHRDARVPADPLRIVVDAGGAGHTGYSAMEALRTRGVMAEMADERRVVLIPTVWDAPEDLARVAQALAALPEGRKRMARSMEEPPQARQAMPLPQAARAGQEPVPLERSAGRVAAVAVGLYPPGVPLLMPGERIEAAHIDALQRQVQAGATPFGLTYDNILCVTEGEQHALSNPAF